MQKTLLPLSLPASHSLVIHLSRLGRLAIFFPVRRRRHTAGRATRSPERRALARCNRRACSPEPRATARCCLRSLARASRSCSRLPARLVDEAPRAARPLDGATCACSCGPPACRRAHACQSRNSRHRRRSLAEQRSTPHAAEQSSSGKVRAGLGEDAHHDGEGAQSLQPVRTPTTTASRQGNRSAGEDAPRVPEGARWPLDLSWQLDVPSN